MTRLRDIVVAAFGLGVLWPLLLLLAVLIRLDSPGPALFRQERVGLHGRTFQIHKFRSMRTDAVGLSVSTIYDPRITRIGRWIRASKLDELPQLIDVLLGDMSLVGPRPEIQKYVTLWPQPQRDIILSVRPGITDPVTVSLRNESALLAQAEDPEVFYVQELVPRKVREYVKYVQERSFLGDLKIIVRTLLAVVR